MGKVFGEENIDKINISFIHAGIWGVWGEWGTQSPPRGAFLELSCGARAARGQPGHPGVAASAGNIKVYLGLHPLLPPCPKCLGFARAQLFKERVGVPVGTASSAADAQEVHSSIFCCFCFTGGPWPPTPSPNLLL